MLSYRPFACHHTRLKLRTDTTRIIPIPLASRTRTSARLATSNYHSSARIRADADERSADRTPEPGVQRELADIEVRDRRRRVHLRLRVEPARLAEEQEHIPAKMPRESSFPSMAHQRCKLIRQSGVKKSETKQALLTRSVWRRIRPLEALELPARTPPE